MIVITILATIALPVFNGIQERAHITEDLNNLRQIGIGTQTYLNDHDNILFSADQAVNPWMKALLPKYLPSWKIFQSPFDTRSPQENNTSSPVSYGLDGNGVGVSADKIVRPSAFILFAPAQNAGSTVNFIGSAASGVTVVRNSSTPGGPAVGGTHTKRKRINALFADLHSEGMTWTTFTQGTTGTPTDDANYRWTTGP